MNLRNRNGRFEAVATYEERMPLKDAGFRWDRLEKRWWTDDPHIASQFIDVADESTKAMLQPVLSTRETARELSTAVSSDLDVPCPDGLEYLPYQIAGIQYAASRPATLIGDEMGLGKTIQAIGLINYDTAIKRVLIVCPASLRLNWRNELRRWLTRNLTLGIATLRTCRTATL